MDVPPGELDDPVTVLRALDLFAGLDDDALVHLAAQARVRDVAAGSWLFRAGERGDELMVVRRGRLEIHVPGAPHGLAPSLLGPGDAVGELAVLGDETRSASALARRDTTLLVLERSVVLDVLESVSGAAAAVVGRLATRLQSSVGLGAGRPVASVLALVGQGGGLPLDRIARSVARHLGAVVVTEPEAAEAASPSAVLERAEAAAGHVVLVASRPPRPSGSIGDADEWFAFCLRSADRIVAVVRDDEPVPEAGVLDAALRGSALAFVGSDVGPRASEGTAGAWIDALAAKAWYQLGPESRIESGSARMARRLGASALGLVLSGGGARGLAHIGVVQGLRELGVEIDRVGGCSMGALVAALVASGMAPAEMAERLRAGFGRPFSVGQIALSRQSLLRADRLDRLLTELFGPAVFEQCATAAFAVSADLLTAELVEHRRGGVAPAVRASMAIPGLLPPVRAGDRVLVDGGLLDNLPVATMARADEGPIVAVDVMRDQRPMRHERGPGMVEVLAQAALLGRRPTVARNRTLARAVLAPAVGDIGLLDFHRLEAAVHAGRAAVMQAAEGGRLDGVLASG